jgi:hypothetical protein
VSNLLAKWAICSQASNLLASKLLRLSRFLAQQKSSQSYSNAKLNRRSPMKVYSTVF